MLRMVCFLLAITASGYSVADVSAVYGFESRGEEQRYQNLIAELRCPKCQNQNIADSNSPISKDMRNVVYQMMLDGALVSSSSTSQIWTAVRSCSGQLPRLRFWSVFLWSPGSSFAPGELVRQRRH
jgi:cytochrome c-type biogenesis protein CcmH/NrfF